ncbi:uncharacterized protein [Parasteatoda tepidariorum]|uniref:uncharacterized protein n=1 Tax=Parasteatoda tepidariorum TaxID=114398 RepID=UPI0039BC6CAA
MIQAHVRNSAEEYHGCRKEVKKNFRQKKRACDEELFKDVEHLKSINECGTFYREINLNRLNFKQTSSLNKNKFGEIITDKQDILKRWYQHFKERLNENYEDVKITAPEFINDTEVKSTTIEEIRASIKNLKNKKTSKYDLISEKLLRNCEPTLLRNLFELITDIWHSEIKPMDWNISILCSIHKKGDPMTCANYRVICLLCKTNKILSKILFLRLLPFLDSQIGKYQCRFRAGKSTKDQIFYLRHILEK